AQALNRPAELREGYENLTRLRPEERQNWIKLGELLDTQNDFKAAVAAYERAVELTPEAVQISPALQEKLDLAAAREAFTDNRPDEAKERFLTFIEQHPDNYIAHFYLALLHQGKGNLEEAAASYEQVLRIVPTHGPAYLSLGIVYEQ